MILKTCIEGCYIQRVKTVSDKRGKLSKFYEYSEETDKQNINVNIKQVNIVKNDHLHLVRGMHAQVKDAKIVTAIVGDIYDIIIDIRKNSATYMQKVEVKLSSREQYSILVPDGCLHGYQTLTDKTEILYLHSNVWKKDDEYGVNCEDPVLNINWPFQISMRSKRDILLPYLENS